MAKLFFKWLMVTIIPLFSISLTSCSDSKDEPSQGSSKMEYTFSQTQNFPKKWMVKSIMINGRVGYSFAYDGNNRPIAILNDCSYSYEGSTCTINPGTLSAYKGYFDGSKLIKAEWREYTITDVTYEGNRLIKGCNRYRLTWDSKGNITNYSNDEMSLTYTDILNKANVDFNMIVNYALCDCWDDDGSDDFTIFGWTGARTTNLISSWQSRDEDDGTTDFADISYVVDELGRPIEIGVVVYENRGRIVRDDKYVITYIEP